MSKTVTAEAVENLNKISNTTPDVEIRNTRNILVGQCVQQGDVYVHRVSDTHARGKMRGSRQVAVGDTVGSRHIAEGKKVNVFEGTKLPEGCKFTGNLARAITGPVVVAEEDWVLTHPEHAHHSLPAGTYQITYQLDAKTQRAVQD